MEAHAKDWDAEDEWDEWDERSKAGHSRPHLRSVERPDERHGAAGGDTEYWIAEARRVREEVDELVSALDARARSSAPRPRHRYEEPLYEEPRDEEAYGEERGLERDPDPIADEVQQMRDEIEHLRSCVASMSVAPPPAPRAPRRRRDEAPESASQMKKLALIMLLSDLI